MFFLIQLGIWAAASWLSGKLAERIREKKDSDSPAPAGEADLELPTVEEGRAIALLWGTCLLRSPNVLWYGGFEAQPNGAGGYAYGLRIMYAWCHGPVDAVLSFRWDELGVNMQTYPPGPNTIPYPLLRESPYSFLCFSSQELFGGPYKEGGIAGTYLFYWGTSDQPADECIRIDIISSNPELTIPPGDFPAYRGLCYSYTAGYVSLWLLSFYQGTSPYIKSHSMVARRCPNQLGLTGGAHDIDGDANPACILYELLTDDRWGMRMSPALINVAAFVAVGETLAAEGFGLSLQQTDQTDPEKIISEILRHIDGVIYPDPATGLVSLSLIRDDYDIEELIEIDDDSIIEMEEFGRARSDEPANKILLRYIDRDQEYDEKLATAVNLAGVASLGRVVTQDVSFLGISKATLAQQVAARELKGLAYPFASLRLKVNRKAWSLRPGSPFTFSYAPLGIEGMVCRVVRMSLGPITDGVIRIEAVEDAFGVDWTAYSPPAPSQWVWPLEPPA